MVKKGYAAEQIINKLREAEIPIDMISGTSIGALVGALYALERNITRIEETAENIDWKRLLSLMDLTLPKTGLIGGKRIHAWARSVFGRDIQFSDLQIPFACVATDIMTGQEIVLNEGSAMYEPDPDNNWRVTYWTGSGNDNDPEANVYGLDGFFPRKNRAVASGSLVEMTIEAGKPHMVEQITLMDEMEDEGFVAIANPMMIQESPAKVVLTVLMGRNRNLLAPQVERIKPIVVEGFHRHL